MPLLKAVVMQSNSTFVASFAGVFVANTTALLCGKLFLVMIQMITANIAADSAVCW